MGVIKVSIASILLCFLAIASAEDKPKLTLYYESLCPYCIQFINQQLYPGYQKIGEIVDIELIPFGNSKITQNGTEQIIRCQHGVNECYGNKIHACAIQNNPRKTWLGFIACTTARYNPYDVTVGEQCAKKFNLPWDKLKACADGDEGQKLVLKYGAVTFKAQSNYSPWITTNDVHDEEMENSFRRSYAKTACSLFKTQPEVCKTL